MKNKVLKTLVLFFFAVLGIFSMQKVEAEVIYEGYKISKQDITNWRLSSFYLCEIIRWRSRECILF